ncbi:MAG: rimM [Acidimicrobiaceae bacterium]|nr:rimM [Acidimicrobiaceae bacterium]
MIPGLLQIGTVMKSHGLRGELVVDLVTNRGGRLDPGTVLTAAAPQGPRQLTVVASRPFVERHLVFFEGVENREDADALRGVELYAEPVEDPDALFVHELIGSKVVEVDGTERGTVTAVEANPASDLLVLDGGFLVPLRFVVERSPGRLTVEVPEGLFE